VDEKLPPPIYIVVYRLARGHPRFTFRGGFVHTTPRRVSSVQTTNTKPPWLLLPHRLVGCCYEARRGWKSFTYPRNVIKNAQLPLRQHAIFFSRVQQRHKPCCQMDRRFWSIAPITEFSNWNCRVVLFRNHQQNHSFNNPQLVSKSWTSLPRGHFC
jgi:hypothetical protein